MEDPLQPLWDAVLRLRDAAKLFSIGSEPILEIKVSRHVMKHLQWKYLDSMGDPNIYLTGGHEGKIRICGILITEGDK